MTDRAISYLQVAVSFLRIGCTAFGGGLAALPIINAELNTKRGWLALDEITEFYALGQTIPGVIIVNTSALAGLRLRGRMGGFLAAVCSALPAFVCILLVAAALHSLNTYSWFLAVLAGIRPMVLAIIAAAAIHLGRRSVRSLYTAALAGLTLALMLGGRVGPAVIIIGMGVWGVAVALILPERAMRTVRRMAGGSP